MKKAVSKARGYLLASQTPEGAWPYVPGRSAAPEPTCYAAMALSGAAPAACERAAAWLSAWSEASTESSPDEPRWAAPLAILALLGMDCGAAARDKLASRLLSAAPTKQISNSSIVELDGSLLGWSWVSGTFSWVEPTSYALLALKAAGHRDHPRVKEGERLLLDRACEDGGWNYGNRKVLGAALPSMAPTTALAALALQGSPSAGPAVARALECLDRVLRDQRSTLSLALAILCFDAFGRPYDHLVPALLGRQDAGGAWRGQVHLTALAVMALQARMAGSNAFKLQ